SATAPRRNDDALPRGPRNNSADARVDVVCAQPKLRGGNAAARGAGQRAGRPPDRRGGLPAAALPAGRDERSPAPLSARVHPGARSCRALRDRRLHLALRRDDYFSQWVMQRDPRYYDDPETFRPERWLDGLMDRLPAGAYFPFGDGPRRCIGQGFALLEAAIVTATIA